MTLVCTYVGADFDFSFFLLSSGGVTSICPMSLTTLFE